MQFFPLTHHEISPWAANGNLLSGGDNAYLYGLGRIGEEAADTWAYHLPDALGSVRQLTNASADVLLAQTYEPYGDVLISYGAAGSNYGYTGEWTDATGLVHLRARYLDTGIGRFITRDTWGGDYNQPMSLNRWMYVEGNPIMESDSSGHYPSVLFMSASNAISFWKTMYSKVGPLCLGLGGGYNSDPNTMGVKDLLVEFTCEIGNKDRLFGENADLTPEN